MKHRTEVMKVCSLSPTTPYWPMKGALADLVNSTNSEKQAVVWVMIANSAIFALPKLGYPTTLLGLE